MECKMVNHMVLMVQVVQLVQEKWTKEKQCDGWR